MTSEEARKVLQEIWRNERTDYKSVEVKEAIDRAIRALEDSPQGEWAKGFHEGFKAGSMLAETFNERPQGEWIENLDKLGLSYICPFCGHEMTGILRDLNYCCKCGAAMRGKQNDR